MATASEIDRLRNSWGWFLALGIIQIFVGGFAVAHPFIAGLLTVSIFGWIMIFSGIVQALFSMRMLGWGGVALSLLGGVLQLVVGIMILRRPETALDVFTLLLTIYFLVGGVFRFAAALALRGPGTGWMALSGLVTAGLGVWLLADWQYSQYWFLGTLVGVDFIFHGVSWVALGMSLRKSPA